MQILPFVRKAAFIISVSSDERRFGIDAGSTTTKAALVGEDGALLYSFYSNNHGNPLGTSIRAIQEIYSKLPDSAQIAWSCSCRLRACAVESSCAASFASLFSFT